MKYTHTNIGKEPIKTQLGIVAPGSSIIVEDAIICNPCFEVEQEEKKKKEVKQNDSTKRLETESPGGDLHTGRD